MAPRAPERRREHDPRRALESDEEIVARARRQSWTVVRDGDEEAVVTLREVHAHHGFVGAAAYNEDLSTRRAITVRDYLADKGIADGRLAVRGYGESQPIADNDTAEGKARNRRVVLRILER